MGNVGGSNETGHTNDPMSLVPILSLLFCHSVRPANDPLILMTGDTLESSTASKLRPAPPLTIAIIRRKPVAIFSIVTLRRSADKPFQLHLPIQTVRSIVVISQLAFDAEKQHPLLFPLFIYSLFFAVSSSFFIGLSGVCRVVFYAFPPLSGQAFISFGRNKRRKSDPSIRRSTNDTADTCNKNPTKKVRNDGVQLGIVRETILTIFRCFRWIFFASFCLGRHPTYLVLKK